MSRLAELDPPEIALTTPLPPGVTMKLPSGPVDPESVSAGSYHGFTGNLGGGGGPRFGGSSSAYGGGPQTQGNAANIGWMSPARGGMPGPGGSGYPQSQLRAYPSNSGALMFGATAGGIRSSSSSLGLGGAGAGMGGMPGPPPPLALSEPAASMQEWVERAEAQEKAMTKLLVDKQQPLQVMVFDAQTREVSLQELKRTDILRSIHDAALCAEARLQLMRKAEQAAQQQKLAQQQLQQQQLYQQQQQQQARYASSLLQQQQAQNQPRPFSLLTPTNASVGSAAAAAGGVGAGMSVASPSTPINPASFNSNSAAVVAVTSAGAAATVSPLLDVDGVDTGLELLPNISLPGSDALDGSTTSLEAKDGGLEISSQGSGSGGSDDGLISPRHNPRQELSDQPQQPNPKHQDSVAYAQSASLASPSPTPAPSSSSSTHPSHPNHATSTSGTPPTGLGGLPASLALPAVLGGVAARPPLHPGPGGVLTLDPQSQQQPKQQSQQQLSPQGGHHLQLHHEHHLSNTQKRHRRALSTASTASSDDANYGFGSTASGADSMRGRAPTAMNPPSSSSSSSSADVSSSSVVASSAAYYYGGTSSKSGIPRRVPYGFLGTDQRRKALRGTARSRDVHKIDPSFLTSHEPCLIVRKHSILLNACEVKAIILYDRLYLLMTPGSENMIHLVEQKLKQISDRHVMLGGSSLSNNFTAQEAASAAAEYKQNMANAAAASGGGAGSSNSSSSTSSGGASGTGSSGSGGSGSGGHAMGTPGEATRGRKLSDASGLGSGGSSSGAGTGRGGAGGSGGGGAGPGARKQFPRVVAEDEIGFLRRTDSWVVSSGPSGSSSGRHGSSSGGNNHHLNHGGGEKLDDFDLADFEFQALDACFGAIIASLEVDWQRLELRVAAQIHALSKIPTPQELHALKHVKIEANLLETRLNSIRDSLVEVLQEDEDLAHMFLTRFQRQPKLWDQMAREPGGFAEHEEAELLLESYLEDVDTLTNATQLLKRDLEASEGTLDTMLDAQRNRLISANLLLNVFSIGVSLMACIFSLFGMNLLSGLEEADHIFNVTAILTSVGAIFFCLLVMWIMKRKGLVQTSFGGGADDLLY